MMAKTWEEVAASDEFRALPLVERERARDQYFNEVVGSQVADEERGVAREQFLSHTKDLQTTGEKTVGLLKSFFDATKRAAGVGFGLVAAVPTGVLGTLESPQKFPGGTEAYNKQSPLDQLSFTLKHGLDVGGRVITEKGNFGLTYNDYYKGVTGKTITEALPDNLKWLDLTVDFIGSSLLDPTLAGTGLAKLASFKVPKNFIGKLPPEIVETFREVQAMDVAERKLAQKSLLDILQKRQGYIKWWENTAKNIDELAEAKQVFSQGVPTTKALPTGQGFILREGKVLDEFSPQLAAQAKQASQLALPKAQGFELVGPAYRKEAEELTLATSRFDTLIKQEVLTVDELKELSNVKVQFRSLLRDKPADKLALISGKTEQLNMLRSKLTKPTQEKLVSSLVQDTVAQPFNASRALFKKASSLSEEKAGKFLEVAELQKQRALELASKFLDTGDKHVVAEVQKVLGTEYQPRNLNMMRASGGSLAGIEQDENGNITYNLEKGVWGTVAVGAAVHLPKVTNQLQKTLAANPAWTKVHNMVGEVKPQFLNFTGALSKVNTALFDRFAPLQELSKEGYRAARTFSSHRDKAQIIFGELREGLTKVKHSEGLFTDYVLAHRSLDRASRGIKNPNNVGWADATQAIKEMEVHYASTGKSITDLKQSLVNFKNWSHENILKASYENGILSKQAYENISNNNEWYAAFDVLEHLPDVLNVNALPAKEYFSVSTQNIIKTMKGTEKLIDNPIKATIKKFVKAQELFERNKVINLVIDDADAAGVFKPFAESRKEAAIMLNQGKNPMISGTFDLKEFEVVSRFRDGVVEKFVAPKFISDSLKQLTPSQAPRIVQAINNVFRQTATTVYLPFTVTNAFRDALMAYTTSPVFKTSGMVDFFGQWSRGLWEAGKFEFLGHDKLMNEYLKAGGGFGYIGELRSSTAMTSALFEKTYPQLARDVVKSPLTLIEKIGTTVEMATRLGVFNKAQMMQFSSEEAAFMARKATIDFSRGGTYTKMLNQWVPFMNARVQSATTITEALKNNPAKTMSKIFVSTTLPALGMYAWNRLYYSKEYDDIPKNIRDNYFVSITGLVQEGGKTKPKYVAIPKGEIGQLGWNAFEFGLDKAFKLDRETTGKFLVGYLSDLSPVSFTTRGELDAAKLASNFLPPVVKGAAENWANLNFYTGQEIIPYYTRKNKPPELQYKENTPESYKWLGKKLNTSPLMLQNLAQNVAAGYGREGLSPDAMIRGLTGRLVKTTSGEINNQAWTSIKDIEQGYTYTRAYAEELIKNNQREKASQLLNEWNKGLQKQVEEFNGEFGDYGIRDKGGLVKSYRFDGTKRRNMFKPENKKLTGVEKRLTPRGR